MADLQRREEAINGLNPCHMSRIILLLLLAMFTGHVSSQKTWTSPKYGYSIEIPKGFNKVSTVGINADFKAEDGLHNIVLVVKLLPAELRDQMYGKTIFAMLGDLPSYEAEFMRGAPQYFINPQFIKSGSTLINKLPAYWMDIESTHSSVKKLVYTRIYMVKVGQYLYTLTFACLSTEFSNNQPVWLRFIDKMKLY